MDTCSDCCEHHHVNAKSRRQRSRRIAVWSAVAAMCAGAVVSGMAAAEPSPDVLGVSYTAITPVKVMNSVVIGANKSASVVVSGGNTTVPTNATSVRLTVTVVGGHSAGTLTVYPAGNPDAASEESLSWDALGGDSTTIHENIGTRNQITFANASTTGTAVTATITGYSTQVTVNQISGLSGNKGQLLTNAGDGSVNWTTQGQAYASQGSLVQNIPVGEGAAVVVDSMTVPAGTYVVTATYDAFSNVADFVNCWLQTQEGHKSNYAYANANQYYAGFYYGSSTVQMLAKTAGGTISLRCYDNQGSGGGVKNQTLIANQVNEGHGSVN